MKVKERERERGQENRFIKLNLTSASRDYKIANCAKQHFVVEGEKLGQRLLADTSPEMETITAKEEPERQRGGGRYDGGLAFQKFIYSFVFRNIFKTG